MSRSQARRHHRALDVCQIPRGDYEPRVATEAAEQVWVNRVALGPLRFPQDVVVLQAALRTQVHRDERNDCLGAPLIGSQPRPLHAYHFHAIAPVRVLLPERAGVTRWPPIGEFHVCRSDCQLWAAISAEARCPDALEGTNDRLALRNAFVDGCDLGVRVGLAVDVRLVLLPELAGVGRVDL